MVERLHVSPNRVRGGGYLLPPLGTTEFMKKGCLLSVQYMPVLEETRSVFIMNQADDTNLVISTSNTGYDYQMLTLPDGTVWYPYFENVHFEVDAVLTDADDIPISGKNVYMIGSQATVDYQVTDSDGECSFYFDMGSQVFSVQAQFLPDSPDSGYVDAISNILNVQCGGCSIGLSAKQGTSTITTVGYKEAFSLEATVHDTIRDVDMNGVQVSFYNGTTLLGTATSNSNGVATLNNVKIITNEGITAKIGDETSTELSLTVTRPIVTVTPDRTISLLYGRINMTIKVVDGNGHNVTDEDVYWFATGGSYHKLSTKTNSNGELTTGVIYTTPGTYTMYAGVDAEGLNVQSERVTVVYIDGVPDKLTLTVNPSIIQSGETSTLSALLTVNLDGTDYPVDGFPVEIYQYNPELFKFNGVIGDWKKGGTGTTITPSDDDVLLVTQSQDTVYLENSLPVDKNWSLEFDVDSMQYPYQAPNMMVYNPVTDNTIQFNNMGSTGHYQVSYIASDHRIQVNLDGDLVYQTTSLASEGYYFGFILSPGRMQLTDVKATISSDTDTWSNLDSRVTVSTTATGTTVAGTTGTLYNMYANVQGNDSSELDFFGDTVVDFDVVTCPSSRSAYVQIHDGNEDHTYFHKNLYTDMGVRDGSHVKITITDGLVEVYVDGVKVSGCTVQTAFTGPYRIGFRGYQLWSFKFTNFNIGGF